MKVLIAAASAGLAVLAMPLAAASQTAVQPGVYANIGYADFHDNHIDLGAIYGLVGYRFSDWLGVEGQIAGGVKDDDIRVANPGFPTEPLTGKAELSHSEAIYGVGFWPLAPNWEVIGRVGYGHTKIKLKDLTIPGLGTTFSATDDDDSWNYGVGAQYHWDAVNGVRADYTRHDFRGNDLNHADVWSIGYDRRF